MDVEAEAFRIELTEFLNLYPLRTPRIMWFLGAGASVTAGLPSAATLTWEFKRALYCRGVSIPTTRFPDLDDSRFQTLAQTYFDSQSGNPPLWDDAEYSHYFQKYLPDEKDRRTFLSGRLSGTKPSLGHFCLASLLTHGKAQIVWTTNFDTLVERAFQEMQVREGSQAEISVVSLANPDVLTDCVQNDRWPVVVKIHGDYCYRKLKNLTSELQSQDQVLRRWLIEECGRLGIAVVGYSGRDASVMEAFRTALSAPSPFPHGLFWFVRSGTRPTQSVLELLSESRNRGVQAGFIEIGGCDELLSDVVMDYRDSHPQIDGLLKSQRDSRKPFVLTYGDRRWPVIRTNALETIRFPSTCTLFQADMETSQEIRELAQAYPERICVSRRKAGLIAFGNRADLTSIFDGHSPRNFDRYPIEPRRFYYSDSQELGLFYDAVCQGLATLTGLTRLKGKKGRLLYIQTSKVLDSEQHLQLRALNIQAVRNATKDGPLLHEAIKISLDYRDSRLWLLIHPTVVATTDGMEFYDHPNRSLLIREQTVRRYNRVANDLLKFWIDFLVHKGGDPICVKFPSSINADAEFHFSPVSAFGRPT